MTEVPGRCGHVAVHFDNDILVTCGNGLNFQGISPHEIWLFNIYTKQWRKHQIPDKQKAPPPTVNACAVVIKRDLYMFGGQHALNTKTNDIWKLSKTPQGCFSWTKSKYENGMKLPSPRCQHAGWVHMRNVCGFVEALDHSLLILSMTMEILWMKWTTSSFAINPQHTQDETLTSFWAQYCDCQRKCLGLWRRQPS